ncbi:DUF4397 domain-containing protein [Alkalimonas mucilaginosa]|uniref:DUF4397 domain-containing protein n=1 Tax=Alkalimonas mucilaginosa TaxID=3057676 RepID=A0ABU7JFQ2_9GAMM|nr:DUF4397 domain-containing protein [Alkalimonas sp. MEB004]MEE2024261.1 DUF4397 domain-containing protein [Alkalimonas sp. MEB004]
MLTQFRIISLSLLVLSGVVACGGSSDSKNDESSYSQSYLQFYHGADHLPPVELQINSLQPSQLSLGQASSLRTLDAAEHTVNLSTVQNQQPLLEDTLTLKSGYKHLMILTEQEGEPELLAVEFDRNTDLDQQFMLTLTNLSVQFPELDIYLAKPSESINEAERLESLSPFEVAYPTNKLARGHYTLYLTKPGEQQVLFQSQNFHFQYNSTYSLIVRDQQGPLPEQLVIDLVLNSNATDQLLHRAAPAQFRLFNSMQSVAVLLDHQPLLTLNQAEFSDYSVLTQGDYQLSVQDTDGSPLLSNQLLSLQQGQSKVVVLFQDEQGATRNLQYLEANRPQRQQHDVTVLNLNQTFAELNLYFVRSDETIQTAQYKVQKLAIGKHQQIRLPSHEVSLALTAITSQGNELLLEKTAPLTLEQDQHYLISLEHDPASPNDVKLRLVY